MILIDTAGPVVGVAAWGKGTFVASERITAGADGWLTPKLAEALAIVGELDRIGVVVGPGAFTGVRVGIAHALGFALARGVGIVPVSSLALRAATLPGRARVLALLDARRGMVYAGTFDTRGAVPLLLDDERDVPPDEAFQAEIATGEGAVVYRDRIGVPIAVDAAASPVAAGRALVEAGQVVPIEQVAPRYLRAGTPSQPPPLRGGGAPRG